MGRRERSAALCLLTAVLGTVLVVTNSEGPKPEVAAIVATSADRLLFEPEVITPVTGRTLAAPVTSTNNPPISIERPAATGSAVGSVEVIEPSPVPVDADAPTHEPTETTSTPSLDASAGTGPLPAIASIATAAQVADSAPTRIPVYDTAWQMLVRGTPEQADEYFAALKKHGFTGAWTGVIHHAPATYNGPFAGGDLVGSLNDEGELLLTNDYITHVRSILDSAARHGMRIGLVPAWQNLYLPGGGADAGNPTSDAVRGTITEMNARAYGRHVAEAFGSHSAVSMWVLGGDAGTNNTEANKAVWSEMAAGLRDAGSRLSITYHTPTSEFNQLNYAGEPWLDFIAPETGHGQDAAETEAELRTAKAVYGLPVWAGEARYHDIDFTWVPEAFRRPGPAEMRADALAAASAGVSGYVYGDAGRWTWCAGFGDASPCDANDIGASFGEAERAVIGVFSG